MAWTGIQYFTVRVSKNAMNAFIPKGTALAPEIASLDYQTFLAFLQGQHGIALEPSAQILEDLKSGLKHNLYGFKSNFEIVTGTPPREGQPGRLSFLKRDGVPSDMVFDGVPFMQYLKPVLPQDGMTVHGEKIAPPKFVDPLQELILPDEMEIDGEGKVIPNASGQAELNGNVVTFRTIYRVADSTDPVFQNMEFHSNVWIEGDLAGSMNWRIYGSLLVDGHLSAGNLEIYGNLEVKQGIQTNFDGVIRVYGSVKTGYLQMTRIAVANTLIVERGILQSDVRALKNVRCMGIPGAIQGAKVFSLGSIQANRAGSDQGIQTELIMPYIDQTKPIKIASISAGTKIAFKDKSWTAAGKSAFSAQADSDSKAS